MKLNSEKTGLLLIIIIVLIVVSNYFIKNQVDEELDGVLRLEPCHGKLTVLYDNYIYNSSCLAEWGFSCLIETPETVILFDTGGEADVLRSNIENLGVDVTKIDCIVLSHEHWDHVGGISTILNQKPDIPVYIPEGCPYHIISSIRSMGGIIEESENATRISDSVITTKTLNGPPREHALIIQTDKGLILITGCSHPGVNKLAKNAHEITNESIDLIIGGFHLQGASNLQLDRICDELDEIGVLRVSPSHCTGDDSIEYFRDRYGENFVASGVGFQLEF
jgi:7,8-dihydropterin-6-yl-methyl-4-(beta-D-ribofuranosyl)aminobenzene 5'-phosphate synthase